MKESENEEKRLKIIDLFKKIFDKGEKQRLLNEPKTKYQELVESIDDLELCRIFVEKTTRNVTPEIRKEIQKYESKTYEYPLQTQISKEDTLNLASSFFRNVDNSFYERFNSIIDGKNPNIVFEMEKYNDKGSYATNPEKIPVIVYVPIRDDIRQLYELIHEITHTFDIENGDTPTRRVLGEVAPQCMERLLDDFLLEMSDEDMKKYGFNRNIIEQDVKDRKISTYLSRFNNAHALYSGSGNREKDSRYMLAQIYSAHFNKFDKIQKKNKLVSFIECVKNDEFDMANHSFDLSIDKKANLNGFYRENYVSSAISEVVNLITPKTQSEPIQYQKKIDELEK